MDSEWALEWTAPAGLFGNAVGTQKGNDRGRMKERMRETTRERKGNGENERKTDRTRTNDGKNDRTKRAKRATHTNRAGYRKGLLRPRAVLAITSPPTSTSPGCHVATNPEETPRPRRGPGVGREDHSPDNNRHGNTTTRHRHKHKHRHTQTHIHG